MFELNHLVQKCQIKLPLLVIEELYSFIDKDGNGGIDFEEFKNALDPWTDFPCYQINMNYFANLPEEQKLKYRQDYGFYIQKDWDKQSWGGGMQSMMPGQGGMMGASMMQPQIPGQFIAPPPG